MGEVLRFAQLQSSVDVTFLAELSEHKLNVLKLSEEPVDVCGFFGPNRYEAVPARLQLDVSSLRPGASSRPDCHAAPGVLLLYNTVEGFRNSDKPALMRQVASQVWADILSGAAEAQPWRLCRFLLLVHGDLKRYTFHYWFAFPALKPPSPITAAHPPRPLAAALPPSAIEQITAACSAWRSPAPVPAPTSDPSSSAPSPAAAAATSLPSTPAELLDSTPAPFWLLSSPREDFSEDVQTHPLSAWGSLLRGAGSSFGAEAAGPSGTGGGEEGAAGAASSAPGFGTPRRRHVALAFSDGSHLPGCPAWQLRNALLLAAVRWRVREQQVLCLRESSRGGGRLDPQRSFILTVTLPAVEGAVEGGATPPPCPDAVGWEANEQGRLLPRFMDLGPHLRPEAQAEQAVDLNLRLMRWRAVPGLDVGRLAGARCLLLGAGTLGCAVARTLQGWGVRHITLVDSGRVAYSNPVRQSLYTFEDCLGGGRPKAAAAAEALRRVFPSAMTEGLELTIPMPGHPPGGPEEEARLKESASRLDALVASHDAVFLLTDTREARWLPALLAAAHGRLAITAAVGFDSFLVMRHGAPPEAANAPPSTLPIPGPPTPTPSTPPPPSTTPSTTPTTTSSSTATPRRLGCYFCNDVVAPANSTRDRSQDQQCTVARPGLAPLAGALAAEMLAAAVADPRGVGAPPPSVAEHETGPAPPLGPVPHMLRGQLASWSQTAMEGWAFPQCTACSAAVVQAYRARGWELIREALADPSSLEALTGLAELHAAAAARMEESEQAEGEKGEGRGGGEGGEEQGGAAEGKGEDGEDEEEDWTEL
ncbi:hypothetical protein HYH03_002807 [Edaphochlamys debaryana]|uniref:Ubiquitin-like modifier-activating enzyme ATG7 n=1 Tax=Edaphochlamys debaryana TaxID=47281 RepID=A0A836C4S7_9CHLO|nr:hypothetical protein HYH03_002807 [Edaphochlamys debaryana]|eukprot:KAG2499228.1 hypothetical protein HYH03_002807 [Edaphochlamys debaryana]